MDWHPLRFQPIYKERVWGGRNLEAFYGRPIPKDVPIGESWEITDRPEGVSVVAEGPLAGRTLAELMATDRRGLLGDAADRQGRFPLLVKILDARDILSLQVHPPASIAPRLGGESKTEMWYFTATTPGAEILAGLRRGVTRSDFEAAIANGSVAHCFHRIPVQAGDSMFLPSGRVHALGAGLLLFEIQENSDTTYRVFDWNRVGLDGKPRPLHVAESLASIDFADTEPSLLATPWTEEASMQCRGLVDDPLFRVQLFRTPVHIVQNLTLPRCAIVGVVQGKLTLATSSGEWNLKSGDFCLIPAALKTIDCRLAPNTEYLLATPGGNRVRGTA
ncbi:MAG: class I mannose-6-phosphate isomerase [Verrucomicrobiales bacterium]|nr:class I mannose-6-phosphate isomerase [Verrucomicrobiales bacterium]